MADQIIYMDLGLLVALRDYGVHYIGVYAMYDDTAMRYTVDYYNGYQGKIDIDYYDSMFGDYVQNLIKDYYNDDLINAHIHFILIQEKVEGIINTRTSVYEPDNNYHHTDDYDIRAIIKV